MMDRRPLAKIKEQASRKTIWLAVMLGAALLPAPVFAADPPPGQSLVNASDNVAQNLGTLGGGNLPSPPTQLAPAQPDPTPQELAQQQFTQQTTTNGNTTTTTRTVTAPPTGGDQANAGGAGGSTVTATVSTTGATNPVDQTNATTEALANALAVEAVRAAQTAANADAARAEAQQKMNDRAYNSAVRGMYPLTTDQIKGLMEKMEEMQNASTPPSYGQPKPQTAVQTVSLDPGAAPPEINVAVGYVTTLTILDASGQPWPIIDIGVGGNFDIPTPDSNSSMVRITPLTRFGYGNLSVRLKDLATPITFRLSAGNDIVHYRYDARIPKMGPNAKTQLIQHTKLAAGDDLIMSVLDNSIPPTAKKLKVTGTDRRTAAYKIGERTFVRTPLSMLSPSWDASVASADGMTVYETGDTPVILLSDAGQLVRVHLTEQAVQ